MIKATKYYIQVVLALLFFTFSAQAQYVGGTGNLLSTSIYTLVNCSTPPQFMAYFGGTGNLNSQGSVNYATCSTPPSQFFAYMGGNNDGNNLLTYTTTSCGTPSQFFAYMGGNNDGNSLLTYTTTSCGTPNQFFAYMGGNADGESMTTFTLCSTNPPVAQYSVNTSTVCVGSAISYSDASQYNPVSWNWVFAGGTPSVSTNQNPNVVYNTAGTYNFTLTVTNAFGSSSISSSVTVNALPTVDGGNNATVCNGNATVLNASGASSYSWSPSTGLSSTNIANPVANPTATTIYTVTGTQNGCSKTDVVTVNVTAAPVANAGPDLNLCVGSTTTIAASGGGTYSWLPAQGLSSTTSANPVVSTTNTTTYTLTVSNGACSDVDVITITVKSLPTANAGTDVTICNGASTVLNASGGSSYTWTPGGSLNFPNSVNPTATPATTTNYTLTVSDGTCTAKDIVTVSVTPLPSANAGTDFTICAGGTATLNASGGTSYTWTPATALSATNISNPISSTSVTTDYTVTVANASACTATDVVRVNVLAAPIANAGSDKNVCFGTTTSLNASGGTSYLWTPATGLSSNTVANPIVNTTVNTTYTVTVSNGACSANDEVNVVILSLPVVNAGSDKVICSGDSVTLNGSGGVTYTWTPTTYYDGWTYHPIIDYPNSVSPKAFPYVNGTTSYTLTASNGSCTATDVVNVSMVAPPNPNAGSDVAICVGNSVGLNASGGTSYTWTPAVNISNTNVFNPTVNPTSTIIYTVSVSNGICVRNDNVTVTVETAPIAYAGADINLCYGSSASLNATGGTGYVWSPAAGLSNPGIANPIVTTTNTTSYTVTVSNAGGCTSTDVMTVNAVSLPTVNAGSDQTVCQGNPVVMNGSGASTFTWSPMGAFDFPNSVSPTAYPNSTVDYTLTTSNGICSASDVMTVFVTPLPNAYAGFDVSICAGASTTLSATGGTSYTWSPASGLSSTTISNPIATPSVTTTYTVSVENNGCVGYDYVTVTITNTLVVDAGIDQTICEGQTTVLSASGGSSYTWTPSSSLSSANGYSVYANPTVTTVYTVNVASGGCSASDVVTLFVNPSPTVSINAVGPTTVCVGGNVDLVSNTSASSYTWSNGANTSSVSVNVTDNYYVTVSNGSCTATSNIIAVTVYTPTAASITPNGSTTICLGNSVVLSANTGTNYVWNTGATTQTISVNSSGTYSVSVDDLYGCAPASSATIDVTVNPNPATPTITAGGATSICIGDSVVLISDLADSYLWSNGATTQSISIGVAGTYSVTNYNSFGCGTISSGVAVAVNDPLADFSATPTLVFIPNAVTSFSANTTGFPPYNYAWDFGDGGTSTSASPSHTYNVIAYKTVSLTVTDNTGCSKTIVKPDYIQVEQLFPSTAMTTGTSVDLTGVSFESPTTGIMSLANGDCLLSIDSGKVWTPLPTGNPNPLTGVCVLPGKWFATGKNGTILLSTDNGLSWNPFTTGTTEDFTASHFASPLAGHAIGKNGTIQKYNGTTFVNESSGTIEHLNGVFEFNNGNAIAVGDNSTILSYNGSSWSTITNTLSFNIRDVRFSDLLNGYVAGVNGNVYQTSDGGATWIPSLTGVDVDFNSIEVASADTAWATGTGGIVYKTVNNGMSWIRYSVGHTGDQSQLRVAGGGKGHVVGSSGNGRYFNNNDSTGVITSISNSSTQTLNSFNVYPNPARDQFIIKGYLPFNESVSIELKDAQARLVRVISNYNYSGDYKEMISTEYFSPGIYFVHIKIGNKSMVQKLVIMK